MATHTLTETKHKRSETSTIMIKTKLPDPGTTSQNQSMKKNKNAKPRKSKAACKHDSSDPDVKPMTPYESNNTETRFSRPELGSFTSILEPDCGMCSVSSLIVPNDDNGDDLLETLDNVMDNLKLQDPEVSNQPVSQIYQNSTGPRTQTTGICSDPKLQAMVTEETSLKATIQRNRVYPENTAPKHLAFTQDCPTVKAVGTDETQNERQTSIGPQTNTVQQDCPVDIADETVVENTARQRPISKEIPIDNQMQLECRDQQSYATNASENSDLQNDGQRSVELPSSVRTAVESLATCPTGGMSDFVVLHTEADQEAVSAFVEHLQRDIGITDLKVDLLSNINAGKSEMQSLDKLHDNYRYILTYVTANLESNRLCRFLQEIVLTLGLRGPKGKGDRVVPVFTEKGQCKILELSVLNGLQYFKYMSTQMYSKSSYVNSVKNLVHRGREKFP